MKGVEITLTDGAAHSVDSNEMAFKLAAQYAFRQAYMKAGPVIMEPIMTVQVKQALDILPCMLEAIKMTFARPIAQSNFFCELQSLVSDWHLLSAQ